MRKYLICALLTGCGPHLAKPRAEGAPDVAVVPHVTSAPPAGPSAPVVAQQPLPTSSASPPERGSPLEVAELARRPADLAAFNDWATKNRLRDNIAHWIAVGLPMQSDIETSLEVKYQGAEAPTAAVATVVQDRYLDDSIRGEKFVFGFVKKPCETCRDKQNGWWVESLDVTQRCWEGRGHQDFSKEPCN